MAGVVTTNIVVQFGNEGDQQYFLEAEIDSRDTGLNGGRTNFLPGDAPYFLVYKSPELVLTFETSSGSIASGGSEIIDVTEYVIFAKESEARLSKYPVSGVSWTKLAGSGASAPTVSGVDLSIPNTEVSVWKATYQTRAYIYRLNGVPLTLAGETSFPVVIVVIGTAT
jgi:hypothetical protein